MSCSNDVQLKYIIYNMIRAILIFYILHKIYVRLATQYTKWFGKTSIKVICCDFLSAGRRRRMEFWNMSKITLMSKKKKSLSSSKLMKQVISYGSNSHFYNQNLSQEPLKRECICHMLMTLSRSPNFQVYRKT